jgi:hypothetical protein
LPGRWGRKVETYIETAEISGPTPVTFATTAVTFVRINVNAGLTFEISALTEEATRRNRNCARIAKRSPVTRATSGMTSAT